MSFLDTEGGGVTSAFSCHQTTCTGSRQGDGGFLAISIMNEMHPESWSKSGTFPDCSRGYGDHCGLLSAH